MNCYECEEEESSRWCEQLQQNYTRAKACAYTWDSQQTTFWWTKSTRRSVLHVLIQSEGRQAEQYSFVSDAGDLKLDPRLDRQPI